MAKIQCKMCGGHLEIPPEMSCGECPFCGTLITLPKITDDRTEQLYNRAEHFRKISEFDKAVSTYEELIQQGSEDPEMYWGLVLSRFGIEYVEDPASHERIPTCHRVQFDSILADSDYLQALELSSGQEHDIYESQAKRIAEIQKDILTVSAQEEPYDVFICYKETTDGGSRTHDSLDAQDIYYQLTNAGYKVFFARVTLEDKLGTQYEPHIFAALNSAKVMLVIGSQKEYFEAVWVKNEWSRFLALMKKDRSKMLFPCYKGMDPYDLPQELSMLQSQDMGKIGFVQDLLRGIKKIIPADSGEKALTAEHKVSSDVKTEEERLIAKAKVEMELGNTDSAVALAEKVTELNLENVEAWYILACHCTERERTEKLFEKVCRMAPENIEYRIAASRELSCFINEMDDFDVLSKAVSTISRQINNNQYYEDSMDAQNLREQITNAYAACMEDIGFLWQYVDDLCKVYRPSPENLSKKDITDEVKNSIKTCVVDLCNRILRVCDSISDLPVGSYVSDIDTDKLDDFKEKTIRISSYYSDPFFCDICADNLEAVQNWVKNGASISEPDEYGVPPLTKAIIFRADRCAEFLIDQGADIRSKQTEGYTPLHWLFYRDNEEDPEVLKEYKDASPLVRKLLEHGADPNAKADDGKSPLGLALTINPVTISPESAAYLLAAGANANEVCEGIPVLFLAINHPELHEVVRTLIVNGNANVKALDAQGRDITVFVKGVENIELLQQMGFNIKQTEAKEEDLNVSSIGINISNVFLGYVMDDNTFQTFEQIGWSDVDTSNAPHPSMKFSVINIARKPIASLSVTLLPIDKNGDEMSAPTEFDLEMSLKPGEEKNTTLFSPNFLYLRNRLDNNTLDHISFVSAHIVYDDGTEVFPDGQQITQRIKTKSIPLYINWLFLILSFVCFGIGIGSCHLFTIRFASTPTLVLGAIGVFIGFAGGIYFFVNCSPRIPWLLKRIGCGVMILGSIASFAYEPSLICLVLLIGIVWLCVWLKQKHKDVSISLWDLLARGFRKLSK